MPLLLFTSLTRSYTEMGTQKDSTNKQSTSLSGTQGKGKKPSAIDIYLVSCLAFAALYVIAEEVRLWLTNGQEAMSLTQGVFQVVTGELFAGVLLYRFKIKRRKSDE